LMTFVFVFLCVFVWLYVCLLVGFRRRTGEAAAGNDQLRQADARVRSGALHSVHIDEYSA
jgi:hypothetical protein